MNGATAVAKILRIEGVEWMSCFPHQPLIDYAAREGIRPIVTRQERTGVNMADGFSRIKNADHIGVFSMQRGPGSENAFGGVAQAFADSIPVLLLPGGHPRVQLGVSPGFDSIEHYQGIINPYSLQLLTYARDLAGGDSTIVKAVLIGKNVDPIISEISRYYNTTCKFSIEV